MTWPTIAADRQRPLIERPRRDMTLQSIQLLAQTLLGCGVHCYEMLNGATVRPSSDFDARLKAGELRRILPGGASTERV